MYVMSSLPSHEQSIAGGIFNTVSKLCNNLGLGIATSVHSALAHQMTPTTPAIRPYLGVYWFAAAAAGVSVLMVPFLTIGTQGGLTPDTEEQSETGHLSEKPAIVNPLSSLPVPMPASELENR